MPTLSREAEVILVNSSERQIIGLFFLDVVTTVITILPNVRAVIMMSTYFSNFVHHNESLKSTYTASQGNIVGKLLTTTLNITLFDVL